MDRRGFLLTAGAGMIARAIEGSNAGEGEGPALRSETVTLFLCGDVMTGRGVDQILPYPSDPRIYESFVGSATEYVELAERQSGPIPRPVDFAYVWGDALTELGRRAPDLRIVNLETAVTRSQDWVAKGINYRMHPANVPCIKAAGIDCCVLANNHVLDWGRRGLEETLATLERAGIRTAGAGRDRAQARKPAVLDVDAGRRVIVLGLGSASSGIPRGWAAGEGRAGVDLLEDLSEGTAREIGERLRAVRRAGDLVLASIHWGGNWGYEIPRAQREFARWLVDEAGVDVVHGHSSHHPKAIEVYHDRPILYGCGDFLNDYEGISGYEEFRGDLSVMYFVALEPSSGRLLDLVLVPMQIRRMRLRRAQEADARWLAAVLSREGRAFRTGLEPGGEGSLRLLRE